MKIVVLIYVFLILSYVSSAQGQKTLLIRCQQPECTELVEQNSTIQVFSDAEAEMYLDALLKKAYSGGYLAAVYDSVVMNDSMVLAVFDPGPVISFALTDFQNIAPETLKKAGIRTSGNDLQKISAAGVYETMNKILTYHENNGFPFAKITLHSEDYSEGSLRSVLVLEKGRRVTIDTIINRGNLDIHPEVLYALTGMFPGEPYSRMRIERISKLITRHRFMRERSAPEVKFSDSSATVYVSLDRRPVNSFDGIIGFMPDYLDEGKLFLTGELNFSLTNSMSLGEQIFLKWRQPQRNSQDLRTGITLPWLIYIPLGSTWDFFLLRKDSMYVNTSNKLSLFTARNEKMKTGAYIHYFSSRSLGSVQGSSTGGFPAVTDMNITSPGLLFEYVTLDSRVNPRSGMSFSADISAGKKTVIRNNTEQNKDLLQNSFRMKAESELSVFFPVGANSAVQIRNYSGKIASEQLFDNELFLLGGLNNLRGFDENRFYASFFSLQTVEYRFLFEENSRFVVFADVAYIERRNMNVFQIVRPLGMGAGIVLETPQGIFSLMYAVGKMQNEPPDLRSSKIHFGYLVVF